MKSINLAPFFIGLLQIVVTMANNSFTSRRGLSQALGVTRQNEPALVS